MDRAGRVLYFGTFSRSIAPAMRVSYMVLPANLLEPFRRVCGFYACSVSNVMQQAIYHFMREGFFEKNLNRMRGIYKSKHDFILGELKKCPWAKKISGENSGLHLLAWVDTQLTENELVEKCKMRGVRIYGLSKYFPNGTPKLSLPVILLGYGGLTEKQISEGLRTISEILSGESA